MGKDEQWTLTLVKGAGCKGSGGMEGIGNQCRDKDMQWSGRSGRSLVDGKEVEWRDVSKWTV